MVAKLPYWKRRMLQIAQLRDAKDQQYINKMVKEYDRLSDKIYKEIQQWVDRYADNEGIDSAAAYEQLSKKEQKTWSMTLKEFRRKAIEGGYDQELNREYFKSRINRLEQLERQLYFELAEEAKQQEENMSSYLKETLNETYLRQIYELTDQGSFSIPFDRYSAKALDLAIRKPWKGSNFSRRVWRNHLNHIPDMLHKTMTVAISQGWGIDRTVKQMMQGIDSGLKNRMTTLVQTESAHLAEVANDKSMSEAGVEKWEWMATLEVHTCVKCASYDGKDTDQLLEEFGFIPNCPDHPNCRCTRVPVIVGWTSISRWQRDPVTGKGIVEQHQSFDEWKKTSLNQDTPDGNVPESEPKPIKSVDWAKHINGISAKGTEMLNKANQDINRYSKETGNEMSVLVHSKTGNILSTLTGTPDQVVFDEQVIKALKDAGKGTLILSHNHPGSLNSVFSRADISKLLEFKSIQALTLQTSNGSQYVLDRNEKYLNILARMKLLGGTYDKIIQKNIQKYGQKDELWGKITEDTVTEIADQYGFIFRRVDND